jgi:transposase
MQEYIALDAHKRYSLMVREGVKGGQQRQCRIAHRRGWITRALRDAEAGTTVAVEATGNWYWIVEEIEAAGLRPALVHPRKAKVMMGCVNKTDKLDATGLNRLQRVGTLPTVWIAPAQTRDERELPRTRMFFARQRAQLKNRIQATLTKHNLQVEGVSDCFGKAGRNEMRRRLEFLPTHTRLVTAEMLLELDVVEERITRLEERMQEVIAVTPAMRLLMSEPGVGQILATVIALETGDVKRFPSAEHYASYSGTTPRVHSSGGKTRFGRLRPDVNRYLKWAFIEAANCVCLHQAHHPERHVTRLYKRIKSRRNHPTAIGAVARHLAGAAWQLLSREEEYREPPGKGRVSTKGA